MSQCFQVKQHQLCVHNAHETQDVLSFPSALREDKKHRGKFVFAEVRQNYTLRSIWTHALCIEINPPSQQDYSSNVKNETVRWAERSSVPNKRNPCFTFEPAVHGGKPKVQESKHCDKRDRGVIQRAQHIHMNWNTRKWSYWRMWHLKNEAQ